MDNVKKGAPSDEELEELAVEIGDSWQSLGRRLGFSEAELTAFHKENEKYAEKSYKMMLGWKQRNGPDALYGVLHVALCHRLVSRKDLATQFCCDKGPSYDPSLSVAKGKGLKEAEVGRETNFTIETRNSEGKQFYQEDNHVTVMIRTPKDKEMEMKIENNKDGKYTVTYTPDSVGQHEVAININDQPLTGSPWSVQVTPHKYETESTFGSRGKGQGQFEYPYDVAVSEKTGNIAVADFVNKRIQIFSSERKYLREFGQKGPGAETLGRPTSVAFTRSGDVIVVHSGNISLFTETGQFIKQVINEHLKNPMRLSIGRDGHLIVCDKGDKTTKVLSPYGTELLHSVSVSASDGSPCFAVYHQDKMFVSYFLVHCVKVFNKEGVFLYNIGSEGSGDEQLKHPFGLAVDKFNNLVVCDTHNSRLQVFTLDGQFVSKTDQHTARLVRPSSLAVSQDGQVFVTDESTHSVHILK